MMLMYIDIYYVHGTFWRDLCVFIELIFQNNPEKQVLFLFLTEDPGIWGTESLN